MRDVGEKGESEFRNLCADDVGITANLVNKDKEGWDFFIEFPMEFRQPIDKTPSRIQALVQVKSTDDKRTAERVTLGNLLKLASSEKPTFICFMQFDRKTDVQRIYIKHFDEELIYKVLKEIREREVTGKIIYDANGQPRLNRKQDRIPLKFHGEEKLSSNSGEALSKKIRNAIPRGMKEYIAEKQKLLKTIGYKDTVAAYKGNFTLNLESQNPFEKIRDITLGLTDKSKCVNFTLYDNRFDIPYLKKPIISSSGGSIEIRPNPIGKGLFVFKKAKYCTFFIQCETDYYLSSYDIARFPYEPNKWKFRFVGKFFEIILDGLHNNTNLVILEEFNTSEKVSFFEWQFFKNFLEILNSSKESSAEVTLCAGEVSQSSNVKFPKIRFSFDVKKITEYDKIVSTVTKLEEIFNVYNIIEKPKFSLDDLINIGDNVYEFYITAINEKSHCFKVVFDEIIDNPEDNLLKSSNAIAVITIVHLILDQIRLVCMIAIQSEELIKNEDGGYEVLSNKIGYRKHIALQRSDKISPADEKDIISEFENEIRSDNILPIRLISSS